VPVASNDDEIPTPLSVVVDEEADRTSEEERGSDAAG